MKVTKGFAALMVLLALFAFGCDTPAEQATEERVEDQQDAAGVDDDVAEDRAEAASEGDLTATDATAATETTATTATTATTGTY